MITDIIQLAGLDAYYQDPNPPANTNPINLGGRTLTIRTSPMNSGKEVRITGIQLLIEHQDLQPLFAYPTDQQNLPVNAPLFTISVTKEMFSDLFADPFSHRVHNIAGDVDFKEGTLQNGLIMDVPLDDENPDRTIKAIGSINKDEFIWTSKEYILPDPITIDAIAWDLLSARVDAPPDSFHYKIKILCKDNAGAPMPSIDIDNGGQMLKANERRAFDGFRRPNVKSFQIIFTAKVYQDGNSILKTVPVIGGKLGMPLLLAINILEEVKSIYEINSLSELQQLCSDFHCYENPGPAISRLTATIDLGARLVNSPYQLIANNNIYDAASVFEYVELKLNPNAFSRFEAKNRGEILIQGI